MIKMREAWGGLEGGYLKKQIFSKTPVKLISAM